LTRLAQDSSIQNVMALRVLAQLAAQYPQAKTAMVEQVHSNKMPYSAWAGVQAALAGEVVDYGAPLLTVPVTSQNSQDVRTYHINYGNQNYRTVSIASTWSASQITQQLAVIDQVIAADVNLETLQFLQDARLSVAGKMSK